MRVVSHAWKTQTVCTYRQIQESLFTNPVVMFLGRLHIALSSARQHVHLFIGIMIFVLHTVILNLR